MYTKPRHFVKETVDMREPPVRLGLGPSSLQSVSHFFARLAYERGRIPTMALYIQLCDDAQQSPELKIKLWFNRPVHIESVFSLFSRAALSLSFLRLLPGNASVNESAEPNRRAAGCGTRFN
jgi:hypothetical protein